LAFDPVNQYPRIRCEKSFQMSAGKKLRSEHALGRILRINPRNNEAIFGKEESLCPSQGIGFLFIVRIGGASKCRRSSVATM